MCGKSDVNQNLSVDQMGLSRDESEDSVEQVPIDEGEIPVDMVMDNTVDFLETYEEIIVGI